MVTTPPWNLPQIHHCGAATVCHSHFMSVAVSCSEFRSLSGRCFAARQFLPLTVPAASHSFQSVPTAPPRPWPGWWWVMVLAADFVEKLRTWPCWTRWNWQKDFEPKLLRFQHVSTKNVLVRWLKSNHKESKPMQKSKQWGESFSMPGLQHITIWLFNIAMENPPFLIGKPSINVPFSIAMLNNQRVEV